ncbi:MAG: thioredoxin family protein [Pyrodictiaceae archaeon]
MVINATSLEEVKKIIDSSKLVLLLAYDSRAPNGRYISGLIDDIAYTIEPVVSVIKVDVSDNDEILEHLSIRSIPRLRLYLNGRIIWEQIGFFMNYSSDKYAIRRGMLKALRNYGLKPRSLGLRLSP